jgi:hypothetical protein
MFSLFINDIRKISRTAALTVYFPAYAGLPHESMTAHTSAAGRLTLASLLNEAALSINSIPEDSDTLCLTCENGQQFINLGSLYRCKLKALIDSLKQADSELAGRLTALYESLAIYDENHSPLPAPESTNEEAPREMAALKLQLPHRLMNDDGLPLKQTNWPKNRNLKRYLQLAHPKSFRNYQQTNLMFSPALNSRYCILDAGAGKGVAIAEIKSANNMTIGITMHEVAEENQSQFDTLCYTTIPDGAGARRLHQLLRGKIDLGFDIYGPGTYAANPAHALIYLGLLLRAGSTFKIIISSLPFEDMDQSPIGFAGTRKRLIDFFRDELNLQMTISRTIISSAVTAGLICKDYVVSIDRKANAPACEKPLDELFALADRWLGKPVNIPKAVTWARFNDQSQIVANAYTLQGHTMTLTSHDWRCALSTIHADYVIQQGIGVRLHLEFDDALSCSEFSIQFAECFTAQPNPDWEIHETAGSATLVYYDHPMDIRFIKHAYANAAGGWACLYQIDYRTAPNQMTHAVFGKQDIAYCAEQAGLQLQQAMNMDDARNIPENALISEQIAVCIYRRDKTASPGLFSIPDTERKMDRFHNQYVMPLKH